MSNEKMIPEKIAQLLVAWFTRTATFSEKGALDQWIAVNDENLKVFEDCLELSLRPITPDPDHSEEESELFEIAVLLHKQKSRTIKEDERRSLNDWITSSPVHQELILKIPRTKNLEIIFRWLVGELSNQLKQ